MNMNDPRSAVQNETSVLILNEDQSSMPHDVSEWSSNSPRKLQYVANFKSTLVALVIFHHMAISYGGSGSVPYQSSQHPPESSDTLIGFNAINQTFFMASFFYVAGHFSCLALQRKSSQQLIRDRIYRLGVPTLLYSLVGPPACRLVLLGSQGQSLEWSVLLDDWKSIRGVRGPVWFTMTLLLFDIALAVIQKKVPRTSKSVQTDQDKAHNPRIGAYNLFSGLGVCALSDFFLRIFYPIDTTFVPLNLRIGYGFQYIASYLLGAYAGSIDFAIPSRRSKAGLFVISIVSSISLVALLRHDPQVMDELRGGWNASAAAYAVWNNATGYLIGTSLLASYIRFAHFTFDTISDGAYPAFLVHLPILTFLGANTDGWRASAVLKTIVIGSGGVVASWSVGLGIGKCCSKVGSWICELLPGSPK